MVAAECEVRLDAMEEGFRAFLEFQASPAYQTFLQWSSGSALLAVDRVAALAGPADVAENFTAGDIGGINDGDTAWYDGWVDEHTFSFRFCFTLLSCRMLAATTLVLFMTIPGQTIFFAGTLLFILVSFCLLDIGRMLLYTYIHTYIHALQICPCNYPQAWYVPRTYWRLLWRSSRSLAW